MSRTSGSRNSTFELTREQLLHRLRLRLAQEDGLDVSFRELARASQVAVATLRHYFQDRDGVICAIFEDSHQHALPFLQEVAAGQLPALAQSVRWWADYVLNGMLEHDLLALYELGVSACARNQSTGVAFVEHVLEPTLQALEARLERHIARGELRHCAPRVAALALFSPLYMGLLHQQTLYGQRVRALDLSGFLDQHVEAWLLAYQVHDRASSSA